MQNTMQNSRQAYFNLILATLAFAVAFVAWSLISPLVITNPGGFEVAARHVDRAVAVGDPLLELRRVASATIAAAATAEPVGAGPELTRRITVPLAHGLGLGAEPPLIGLGRGRNAALDDGMVLSVQSWMTEEGVGGCLERATVELAGNAASTLTRYARMS